MKNWKRMLLSLTIFGGIARHVSACHGSAAAAGCESE